MQTRSVNNSLLAGMLLGPALLFTTTALAQNAVRTVQSAHSVISLAPSTAQVPAANAVLSHEASFANPPANFHSFSSAQAGESGVVDQLTLRFSAQTKLTKIAVQGKDFTVYQGSCIEGDVYPKGGSCVLDVRFTPQGAGRRLGKIVVTDSVSVQPLTLGLGGYGYAPVISFNPAVITTVPGTYPGSVGLLNGAQNLTVDGGDTLYIADTGNNTIRYIDSSGTIRSLASGSPYIAPYGIAVDSFGEVYFDLPAANSMYEVYDYGPVVQVSGSGTGGCPSTAPCTLSSHAISIPGEMSIDSYNHMFWVDNDGGAALSTVQPIPANLIFLYDPFPYQTNPSSAMSVDASDNLYSLWANGSVCQIVQQTLYNAEFSNVSFIKVAGGHICGFSGDGGQAGNAEIGPRIGQIAFDIAGNLYFSDTNNQRVRRIDYTTGIISTIAGNGNAGYYGDGGPATFSHLSTPTGVAVDSQGQVYIISAAASGQVIRKIGPNGMLSFGQVAQGTSSAAQVVTISNTGNSGLSLTNDLINGQNPSDFTIDPNTTSCLLTPGAVLPSGQSCKVGIIFSPSGTSTRTANLVFLDNSVTGSNTVVLNGSGVLAPGISFSPTSLTFAPLSAGTMANLPVTVTNTGLSNLSITYIGFTGTNYSSFSHTSNCGGAIAPSHTCTVQVSFSPSAAGSYSASMEVADNVPGSPQFYSVSGSATSAAVIHSTTNLLSSANPGASCNGVTFSATVTGSDGVRPTGTVQLMNGSNVLATASLTNGVAIFPAKLAAGKYALVARYSGDKTHAGSTSPVLNQTMSLSDACRIRLPISQN